LPAPTDIKAANLGLKVMVERGKGDVRMVRKKDLHMDSKAQDSVPLDLLKG